MNTVSAAVSEQPVQQATVVQATTQQEPQKEEPKNDTVVDIFSTPSTQPSTQTDQVADMFNFTAD